ncbi:MAG: DUF2192 domain-containing protein [Thermoprotei archaeon]|nr:DUF2192 domain-containing protein [Thermoprotei archaeon]
MVKGRVDVKRRLNVLMEAWNKVIEAWEDSGGNIVRGDVVKILESVYAKESIKPIKGASDPADLYDKELASLYVVGKHGMGLEDQFPELFDTVFHDEVKYESVINVVLSELPERAREKVKAIIGSIDDNTLARILRLKLTEVFFGFSSSEDMAKLLKTMLNIYPNKAKTIKNYAKFYIAFKVAESISKGEIRDRISKEALKHALALNIGLDKKKLPDDSYIRKIAVEVFNVPDKVLTNILSVTRKERKYEKEKKRS